QRRLPTMYPQVEWAQAGGLMSYGPSAPALARRAAYFVDRILKGAKPADLPVELPMILDFAINLQTAQALGLTIPQSVLLQATEVLQGCTRHAANSCRAWARWGSRLGWGVGGGRGRGSHQLGFID